MWGAVVNIEVNGGFCTATKIGTFKFLTAAHCVDHDILPGDNLIVTNDFDGLDGLIDRNHVLTITALHIHPSWEIAPVVGDDSRDNNRVYDIAVVEVEEYTADIPTMLLSADYIGDGEGMFFLVGYGCDQVREANGGTKMSPGRTMAIGAVQPRFPMSGHCLSNVTGRRS